MKLEVLVAVYLTLFFVAICVKMSRRSSDCLSWSDEELDVPSTSKKKPPPKKRASTSSSAASKAKKKKDDELLTAAVIPTVVQAVVESLNANPQGSRGSNGSADHSTPPESTDDADEEEDEAPPLSSGIALQYL